MNHRRIIAVLGAMAVAIPLIGAAAVPSGTPARLAKQDTGPVTLPLEGYLMTNDGAAQYVERDAKALSLVGVDGINLTPDGAALTDVPASAADIVTATHAKGLKAELLMGNFDDSIGDFSPAIATNLLGSPANRTAVAQSLVAKVTDGGFDGVQLDLESLDPSHKAGLVAFVTELRADLPATVNISMALMAADSPAGYTEWGYDIPALTGLVGRFVLMAYDQHGPTWNGVGPVGGTPWVTSVLNAFIQAGVPKEKIDLGVAGYGYTWPGDGTDGVQLTDAQARAMAGDAARWDATQEEWTATLADGTVMWWSDSRTLASRVKLAADTGVHGVALWELSLSDPLVCEDGSVPCTVNPIDAAAPTAPVAAAPVAAEHAGPELAESGSDVSIAGLLMALTILAAGAAIVVVRHRRISVADAPATSDAE